MLDDVFRGIRDKNYPELYKEVVAFCKKYPSLHKVTVQLAMNDEPKEVLKYEAALFKEMASDKFSLNNLVLGQFKPDWMLREALSDKCSACIKTGVVSGKKMMFKFCPSCGRAIKKVHPSVVKKATLPEKTP